MKRPSNSNSNSNSCSSSLIDDDRPPKKSRKNPPIPDPNRLRFNGRSSAFRGVTRHRWTGRFEAHLWDKSSYNCAQNKKGKQVYLGAYDSEEDAARTYDLAALKYWGIDTVLNFPKEKYTKEMEEMQNVSKQDYLASIRRASSGFSRGVSKYRGVARHHHNGRWEARIGRVFGNKYLYLGTFSSQEEAAKAYDLAAIQYRGRNAVTNFDISNYIPKEEPEPEPEEEKPLFVDTKPDQLQLNHEQQQDHLRVSAEKETELTDNFTHSPLILTDSLDCDFDQKDEPWSFCLDTEGHDPLLLVPLDFHSEEWDSVFVDHNESKDSILEDSSSFYRRVFHDEDDSNLFDRHVFRNEEELDLNLFDDLRAFRNDEEVSNLFDHNVFRNNDEDSVLFDHYVVRNEEESNMFGDNVFRSEEEEEPNGSSDLHDSSLFDVLDEKAFEDDFHLIFKDGKKIDSSSSSSSSSTVTSDMF